MVDYRPRIIDSILERKLRSKGAILIEGPKWCGKTTTAEQASMSMIAIDEPSRSKAISSWQRYLPNVSSTERHPG